MVDSMDYTLFATGPGGRVRLGPFTAGTALAEARALNLKHWTGIRFFNAATKIECGLPEMEARVRAEADEKTAPRGAV